MSPVDLGGGCGERAGCGRAIGWVVLTVLLVALMPGAWGTPRLWVEAALEPATVPVNAQATFVLRFGHAVDVRAPRLDPPAARLAEVVPLGPVTQSEVVRAGIRYRVHERRFAVLPFASGELLLAANVAGTTPAVLSEIGGQAQFVLASPPQRLDVRPAVPGGDWLPADNLQIFEPGAARPMLRVGAVWTRRLLIEADGVDGSVIAAPSWPNTTDWTLQFDPPEFGRRIEHGRVIGYRAQTVQVQARRSGRLTFPAIGMNWWHAPSRRWRSSVLPAQTLDVAAAATGAETTVGGPVALADREMPGWIVGGVGLAMVLLVLLLVLLLVRRRLIAPAWQRYRQWSALVVACRANDPLAAKAALLAWCAARGQPLRSLDQWAAAAGVDDSRRGAVIDAIQGLEAACYGRSRGDWDGARFRLALRGLSRGRFGAACTRLSSPPAAPR